MTSRAIYAKAGLSVPLAPRLAVWYDVGKVRGAYGEASLSQSVPLGAARSVTVSGTAGISAGQAVRDGESSYFVRDGLAFIDAAATGVIPVGGLSFAPTVHVLLARDPATRITSPTDQARRFKTWIGTTVTFTRAFRAAPKKS